MPPSEARKVGENSACGAQLGQQELTAAEELAVDKKACKEGGLTVEQGGAGPVVAFGGAVR